MWVSVCTCCYPALTHYGSAGRGKPKTKSKQRTSKTEGGETVKLVVGEASPCSILDSALTVATAFATWLLHFTQFGASSEKFLQSLLVLTDVIKKHRKGGRKKGPSPP